MILESLKQLKNNYKDDLTNINSIFRININPKECRIDSESCSLEEEVLLSMIPRKKEIFESYMKCLINNDLLFIGAGIIDNFTNIINNPIPKALKLILENHLQPIFSLKISNQINNRLQNNKQNNTNNCIQDEGHVLHVINLRKWTKYKIEFKNSWGLNFSISNIKELSCTNIDNNNELEYYQLMIDINKMKTILDSNLCFTIVSIIFSNIINSDYYDSIESDISIQESIGYNGSYDEYGFFNGSGKMIYPSGSVYEGDWKNGIREGQGKMTFSDGFVYEGELKNDIRGPKTIINENIINIIPKTIINENIININTKNNELPIKTAKKYLKYKNKYLELKKFYNK